MYSTAPAVSEGKPEVGERIYVASHWLLMWWRFRKHRLAVGSCVVLAMFYLVALFAEFLATAEPTSPDASHSYLPPQAVHWIDGWKIGPYVYAVSGYRDPVSYKKIYEVDRNEKIPVHFFGRGFEYKFLGFISTDRHLFSVGEDRDVAKSISLLGGDVQGRDQWSRLMFATRTSMSIGLVGVALSLLLGITLGGISGYYGGFIDTVIQRSIEILRSIPTIPLWMGLAAALPGDWSVIRVYFAITIIISLMGWTELARVVRGRFLSMREEDFVTAARLDGAGEMRIMFRHMLPSFYSHVIAASTLAVPFMIISETSLSFLGLGLRPPAVSYGVLLQQAQNVQTVALSPWLLAPAIPVIIAVLAFNFAGDGLRDAADPYGQ